MITRRGAMLLLAAASASPAWGQEGRLLPRQGGVLLPPGEPGDPRKPIQLAIAPPWGQVLRTFGNPVLEGHFAVRVSATSGQVCMAMWDLGDRVLGLAQMEAAPSGVLWDLIAVVMGRKPDIAIGRPEVLYESDHFESAHWQLDEDTAARIGQRATPQARRWVVPARTTARAIEPLTRGLLPPVESEPGHVLWHEPLPDIPTGARMAKPYRLGEIPRLDRSIAVALRSGRMLTPVDARAARMVFVRNQGPALMPIADRDGTPLGRIRVLIV